MTVDLVIAEVGTLRSSRSTDGNSDAASGTAERRSPTWSVPPVSTALNAFCHPVANEVRHSMTASTSSLRVLYPGSFDPIHLGHVDVIEQAAELFGAVVVAVMHNPSKPSGLFPVEQRVESARSPMSICYGRGRGAGLNPRSGLAVQGSGVGTRRLHREGPAHRGRLRGRTADGPQQLRRHRDPHGLPSVLTGARLHQ